MNKFLIISLCTLIHSLNSCITEYKYYRIANSQKTQAPINDISALQKTIATHCLIQGARVLAAQEGDRTFKITIWKKYFGTPTSIHPLHDITLQCTNNEKEPENHKTFKYLLDDKTKIYLLKLQKEPISYNS